MNDTITIYKLELLTNEADLNDDAVVDTFSGTMEDCKKYFNQNYDRNDYLYSYN